MSDYERQRLQALRQLNLLDTPPSESFDRITRLASQLFRMPVAAISLTDHDRQWFKSRTGTELRELPRYRSPCSDVSAASKTIIIEDFQESPCYRDSPQAQLGLRFYAGAPLRTHDGYTLGTICVLDYMPHSMSQEDIRRLEDLSAMVMAQIDLQHALGRIDPTTGLPNRSQFVEDLDDLERDSPGTQRFALFVELVDIVQVSTLNRVMGPSHVDELTREGRQRLETRLSKRDKLYAVGPCQYVILLAPGCEQIAARKIARQLDQALGILNRSENLPVTVRPVVGIAPFLTGHIPACDILRIAHGAGQDARAHESGEAVYSPSLDSRHQRRFTLLTDLRQALHGSDELHLVYQPRVAIESGQCTGAEALLRWRHPQLGDISPREFIPLVENTPLARGLTAWVVRSVIAQAADWHRQGLMLKVSANVMASNLEEENFTGQLLDWLAQYQLPPGALELELTESTLVSNRRAVRQQLNALTRAGIRIAIDDFGTGYSSLSYLLKIPANVVKIDRAFTTRREGEKRREILLKAMIDLAHGLGYQTVAEGFAPSDMIDTLRQLGCDEAQSHIISKPLAANAFRSWHQDYGAGRGLQA